MHLPFLGYNTRNRFCYGCCTLSHSCRNLLFTLNSFHGLIFIARVVSGNKLAREGFPNGVWEDHRNRLESPTRDPWHTRPWRSRCLVGSSQPFPTARAIPFCLNRANRQLEHLHVSKYVLSISCINSLVGKSTALSAVPTTLLTSNVGQYCW